MSDRTLRLGRQDQDGADAPQGRDQRVVLIAGSLLAAAALAAGGVLLLGGGGGEEQATLASAQSAPVVSTTPAKASPSASPSPTAVTVEPAGRPRDPFRALIVAPVDSSTTDGAAAPEESLPPTVAVPEVPTDVAPLPVPTDEPVVDPYPFPETPPLGPVLPDPATSPTPDPSAAPAVTSVTLLRVLTEGEEVRAEFALDGKTVAAKVGEQLGGSVVRLLTLQQDPESDHWTAVLKNGAGEPFDVAIGVATLLV